jgi:pyrroloquinoline quinone biosynthesis protein D
MNPGVMKSHPRLRNRARLEKDRVTGNLVVLHQEGIIELNGSGGEVLLLCDGTRSLSEILQSLEEKYPGAQTFLGQEVLRFLELINQKGLLELR